MIDEKKAGPRIKRVNGKKMDRSERKIRLDAPILFSPDPPIRFSSLKSGGG